MASWPLTLSAPSSISRRQLKRRIQHAFETGDSGCIDAHSRMRRRFELSWDLMSLADFTALENFFDAHSSANILWTDPQTGVVHTVRFAEDGPIPGVPKGRFGWYQVGPVALVEV